LSSRESDVSKPGLDTVCDLLDQQEPNNLNRPNRNLGEPMANAHDTIAAHYAAAAAGDVPSMFKDFADDIVWKESDGSAYTGTYRGMAEVGANIFGRITEEWEGFGAIPDYFLADEATGKVAAVCTYVGTFRATGKPQNVRVVHLWTVKDGKVVAFEQVCDTAEQNKSMS
jgi:ketosteroid isomerase-like protein